MTGSYRTHGNRFSAFALGALLSVTAFAQHAQEPPPLRFPGEAADSRTLDARRQVEALYASGAFERALLIYEKELAPVGDKYAQYMVGYMHLAGQGVPENRAEAYAWYRLAAERGEAPLVKARDTLERTLDEDELARANARFVELWQHYGDRKLLLELIADDLEILRGQRSSDRADAGPGAAIVSGYFGGESGDAFYRRVRERLERRMEYLESTDRLDDVGRLSDTRSLERLESEVRQALDALNPR